MSTQRGLSLVRCQQHLARAMPGRAPSRSTLQRHAKAGDLVSCVVPGTAKRPKYDLDKLKEHYRDWVDDVVRPTSARLDGGAVAELQVRAEHIEQIARAVVAPVLAEVAKLSKEVAALNAVRVSLMQKYDASAAFALDRAESLDAQLKEHPLLRGAVKQ